MPGLRKRSRTTIPFALLRAGFRRLKNDTFLLTAVTPVRQAQGRRQG